MTDDLPVIAVLGGTGKEGSGLALRWVRAGYAVIIGSRDAERAEQAASEIAGAAPQHQPRGMGNREAAIAAEIVVLSVPFAVQQATLADVREALQGKILIDVTAPLVPPRVGRVQLPPGGSAVAAAQELLGDGVRVVSAFQNVSAQHLADLDHDIDCDILVCGDDKAAREQAIKLAEAAGMRGWHAGPLVNSAASEALTSVLVSINRAYKIPGAGIRITGTPKPKDD
ncbi:MAG: NADPH-dependent F420 reductase [Alphaproteobacteria bacterium]